MTKEDPLLRLDVMVIHPDPIAREKAQAWVTQYLAGLSSVVGFSKRAVPCSVSKVSPGPCFQPPGFPHAIRALGIQLSDFLVTGNSGRSQGSLGERITPTEANFWSHRATDEIMQNATTGLDENTGLVFLLRFAKAFGTSGQPDAARMVVLFPRVTGPNGWVLEPMSSPYLPKALQDPAQWERQWDQQTALEVLMDQFVTCRLPEAWPRLLSVSRHQKMEESFVEAPPKVRGQRL